MFPISLTVKLSSFIILEKRSYAPTASRSHWVRCSCTLSISSSDLSSAGVIGLQTAITLLQAGHEVNVIAQYFPGDEHESYTSPWAGAHWRTHASKEETEACDWDTQTYHAWKHLLAEEKRAGKAGESGIYVCQLPQS